MQVRRILKGLSPEQRDQEKKLWTEVFKELKNYQASRRELGQLLLELHDQVVGAKRFKEYLGCLGIARRSAYRWMNSYSAVAGLPETAIGVADKRKIDLGSEKYRDLLQEIPLPENPSAAEIDEWLNKVEEGHKDRSGNPPQSSECPDLTPEERNRLTIDAYVKSRRGLTSQVSRFWVEVPSEERSIEVVQSLMGVAAAQLGMTEPFTVIPEPNPEETNRLVERLEEMATEEYEVGEKVAV